MLAYGAMLIPPNFTSLIQERFKPPINATIVNETTISVYLDMSNYQIAITIEAAVNVALNSPAPLQRLLPPRHLSVLPQI